MTNAGRQKISGFEQNIPGVFSNAGLFAAHYSADSNRALLIRDHTRVRLEGVSLIIEREKFFTVAGESHVDIAFQRVRVEGMRRLTELEHYEVRNVDNVVDRTDPDALDLRSQPLRTRAHMDGLDPTRREERALAC